MPLYRRVLLNWRPSRPISRVLSRTVIYLGRRLPVASCGLPETRMGRAVPRLCLALLPVGVTWPPVSPRTPVVSYTTFSPLPGWLTNLAVCFSVALFRRVAPTWALPSTVPCGARTFLNLRIAQAATIWPTWALIL